MVDNLSLRAEGRPILLIRRVLLELAEIPRSGQPIRIQRIEAERPEIQLVQRGGRLVGWSGFVKPGAGTQPESAPAGRRLSEVLVLRHVAIRDGQVLYDKHWRCVRADDLPGNELSMDSRRRRRTRGIDSPARCSASRYSGDNRSEA